MLTIIAAEKKKYDPSRRTQTATTGTCMNCTHACLGPSYLLPQFPPKGYALRHDIFVAQVQGLTFGAQRVRSKTSTRD
jgi:hypothetical protein